MPRVICAGHVNWDVTLHVDRLPVADGEAKITDQRQGGGGSASNVAVVLAQLDVDATLLGSVGDDEYGLLARDELGEFGVETDLVVTDGDGTTVKYLVVSEAGEVMVLGNDGANEAFDPDDVDPDTIRRADHVHLTSQRPETARRLLDVSHDAGLPVSFAPGRRLSDRDYSHVAKAADVLFLNGLEADAHCDDPAGTARQRGQTILVTDGSEGATAYTPEGTVEHPGFDVDPVDTTGAGDAFAAGFVAARFERDIERALAVGNACGAIAARTMGARTRVNWDDLSAYLD